MGYANSLTGYANPDAVTHIANGLSSYNDFAIAEMSRIALARVSRWIT